MRLNSAFNKLWIRLIIKSQDIFCLSCLKFIKLSSIYFYKRINWLVKEGESGTGRINTSVQKNPLHLNVTEFKILHFRFDIMLNILRETLRVCAFLLSCTRSGAARHLWGLIDCIQHMRWPEAAIRRQKVIVLHQPRVGDTDTCVWENTAQPVKEKIWLKLVQELRLGSQYQSEKRKINTFLSHRFLYKMLKTNRGSGSSSTTF